MSRLSPGRRQRPAPWAALAAALGLFFSLMAPPAAALEGDAGEAADKGPVSGVVEPKVSRLSPDVKPGAPKIEEYTVPTAYSVPYGLAIDGEDRVWFTQMAGNQLAVFDPATGELKEYRIPSTMGLPESDWEYDPKSGKTPEDVINIYSVGGPGNISISDDGMVWFVMQLGNSVVRFDPGREEFTEFLIPTEASLPYDIAADSNDRVWFVEKNSGAFGYLDIAREKVVEIELGRGVNPMGIAVGENGHVWLSLVGSNVIGRYDPETKKLRTFPINVPNSQPGLMRFDEDGRLWICHLRSQHLGVLIPNPGVHSVVPMPGYNAVPQGLAPGPGARIWVVDSFMNKVGFFHSAELYWNMFEIPTANAQPMNVALDSKGDVWFTESDRNSNSIARLVSSTIPAREVMEKREQGAPATASGGAPAGAHESYARFYAAIAAIVLAAALGFFMLRKSGSKR